MSIYEKFVSATVPLYRSFGMPWWETPRKHKSYRIQFPYYDEIPSTITGLGRLQWQHFVFEINNIDGETEYRIYTPDQGSLDKALQRYLPGTHIVGQCESAMLGLHRKYIACGRVELLRYHYYPLRIPEDRMSSLETAMVFFEDVQDVWSVIQFVFEPKGAWYGVWSHYDKVYMHLRGEYTGLTTYYKTTPTEMQKEVLKSIEQKMREIPYLTEIRIYTNSDDPKRCYDVLKAWQNYFDLFGYQSYGNRFQVVPIKKKGHKEFYLAGAEYEHPYVDFRHRERCYVSGSELVALLPIPYGKRYRSIRYEDLSGEFYTVNYKSGDIQIGEHESRPVYMPAEWYHMSILGKTRTGKSTAMLTMALQLAEDLENIVVLIDPHGDLVEDFKRCASEQVRERIIEIDPARNLVENEKVRFGMNLLSIPNRHELSAEELGHATQLITSNLLSTIRSVFGEEYMGPRIDYFISTLAKGLMENSDANLVDLYYILTDEDASGEFAKSVKDETVRNFVLNELPQIRYEDLISTINKVGKIVQNPLLRIALCQRSNAVQLSEILRKGRVILLRNSISELGVETSKFIGMTFLVQLWLAILARKGALGNVYVFVDEAQNIAETSSLPEMLSESAKYNLHLVLANQYISQLPQQTAASVFGNIDTWLFFQVGTEDAKRCYEIAHSCNHAIKLDDFMQLERHHGILVIQSEQAVASMYTIKPERKAKNLEEVDKQIAVQMKEYERDEVSMLTPYRVLATDALRKFLSAVLTHPASIEQLAAELKLSPEDVYKLARYSARMRYTCYDKRTKLNYMTQYGREYLKTLMGQRGQESDTHKELISKFVAWANSQGYKADVCVQKPFERQADGILEQNNTVYNIEVEVSFKHANQIKMNYERSKGRCIFVVQHELEALRLTEILGDNACGKNYWIYYPQGEGFVAYKEMDVLKGTGLAARVAEVPSGATNAEPQAPVKPLIIPVYKTQKGKERMDVGKVVEQAGQQVGPTEGVAMRKESTEGGKAPAVQQVALAHPQPEACKSKVDISSPESIFKGVIVRKTSNTTKLQKWLAELHGGTENNKGTEEHVSAKPTPNVVVSSAGTEKGKKRAEQEQANSQGLNERQLRAVEYVKSHGRITNAEYRDLFGISNYTAWRELKELTDKQILTQMGAGRDVYYVLSKKAE